jgi:hypothetical protein
MNELDRLIRQFQGADYFEEPENHGRYPIWLYVIAAPVVIGIGYGIARVWQAFG